MSKQVVEQYYEQSDSSDKQYTVTVYDDGSWACSCKRWTTRVPREDCKHIERRKENVARQSTREPEPVYISPVPAIPRPKPQPAPETRGVLEMEHVRQARPDGF